MHKPAGLLFRLEGAIGLAGSGRWTVDDQHPVAWASTLLLEVNLGHPRKKTKLEIILLVLFLSTFCASFAHRDVKKSRIQFKLSANKRRRLYALNLRQAESAYENVCKLTEKGKSTNSGVTRQETEMSVVRLCWLCRPCTSAVCMPGCECRRRFKYCVDQLLGETSGADQ